MQEVKSNKKTQRITQIILISAMVVVCLIVLVPLVFMVLTSFRSNDHIRTYGFKFIPDEFTTESYREMLKFSATDEWGLPNPTPVLRWFLNSLMVGTLSTVLTVLIDALAAYGYARMKFKGRDLIFAGLMFTMMIPGVVTLLPSYSIVSTLGLKGTIWALILPGLSGVGNIFLIRQFMYTIPKQLDEAASIDGAGHIRIFFSIVLPQLVPVLITVGLFTFLGSWNDLLWPILVLTGSGPENYTLTMGLSTLTFNEYANVMAAAVISAVPVMLIYLFAQKFLLQGISLTSGIKD